MYLPKVDISSLGKMEECTLYSDTTECSQMCEYERYVIQCMFYENDEEEVVDLEQRKTGGREISQNTLSIENVIRNQGLN